MWLIDYLKKVIRETKEYNISVRYNCDSQKPISNDEYQRIREKEIHDLESRYDLTTPAGIYAIPVPQKRQLTDSNLSVTGRIEYYLMSKAGQYERFGENELALACYRKANELMPVSPVSYPRETYMRLPQFLRKIRKFDEARKEEQKIIHLFTEFENNMTAVLRRNLDEGLDLFNTDLVEASYIRACCPECAKYRNRVYSMSGHDKRFPRLPDALYYNDHDCGIILHPFIYKVNKLEKGHTGKKVNVIRHSNRPFVDDRSSQERADYIMCQQEIEKQRTQDICRSDYEWLWEYLPEICPKSFSGYMRMRNANTVNFDKILKAAANSGRTLH